jgi:hypothetical protein
MDDVHLHDGDLVDDSHNDGYGGDDDGHDNGRRHDLNDSEDLELQRVLELSHHVSQINEEAALEAALEAVRGAEAAAAVTAVVSAAVVASVLTDNTDALHLAAVSQTDAPRAVPTLEQDHNQLMLTFPDADEEFVSRTLMDIASSHQRVEIVADMMLSRPYPRREVAAVKPPEKTVLSKEWFLSL